MRFLGVPVRLDISAIALVVFAFNIAEIIAPNMHSELARYLIFAGIIYALLLVSILWHERGHILAASRYGIGCDGIIIFALGGVALLKGPARRAQEALWIAIAGPMASFVAAGAFYFGYAILDPMFPHEAIVRQTLIKLAILNFVLGSFNMIPIFPLDGGRVLYGILWARIHDEHYARRLCVYISRVAIVLIFALVLIPLVLIGILHPFAFVWYLFIAALLWKIQKAALEKPLAFVIPAN